MRTLGEFLKTLIRAGSGYRFAEAALREECKLQEARLKYESQCLEALARAYITTTNDEHAEHLLQEIQILLTRQEES